VWKISFKLAELFIDISTNDKQALTGIGRVQGAFAGLGSKLLALGGAIGGGMFLNNAIQGAANLAETVDKVKQVFGTAAPTITGFADELADKFGLVKQPIMDAAALFGLMAKGTGMADDEAAKFAQTMTMLAADAQSLYNVPLDVALEKIRSGLSGEAEPLRAFGVFLSDDAMKAQAMAMGMEEVNGKLTEGQKIMVRSVLIQKGLATASGNLEATLGGTANQQKKLLGDLTNATNDFGTAIMPVWNSVLAVASGALKGINGLFKDSLAGVTTFATEVAIQIGTIGIVFRNFGAFTEIVALTFGQAILNMQEWGDWLFNTVLPAYGQWFMNDWVNGIQTALNFLFTVFNNVFTNIVDLVKAAWNFITNPGAGFDFTPTDLLKGFDAELAKLPEIAAPHLSNFQGQIDELTMQMGDAEQQRQNTLAGAGAAGKPNLPGGDTEAAAAEAKARTTTLEGFAKSLMESGFSKDKGLAAQEATAENTAKIAAALSGGAASLGNIVATAS
jgi:hypothetical protein